MPLSLVEIVITDLAIFYPQEKSPSLIGSIFHFTCYEHVDLIECTQNDRRLAPDLLLWIDLR